MTEKLPKLLHSQFKKFWQVPQEDEYDSQTNQGLIIFFSSYM